MKLKLADGLMENKHFRIRLPRLGLRFLFMDGMRDVGGVGGEERGGCSNEKGTRFPASPGCQDLKGCFQHLKRLESGWEKQEKRENKIILQKWKG